MAQESKTEGSLTNNDTGIDEDEVVEVVTQYMAEESSVNAIPSSPMITRAELPEHGPSEAVAGSASTILPSAPEAGSASSVIPIQSDGKQPNEDTQETIECVICLESVAESEDAKRLTCGHIFHKQCIEKWQKGSVGDVNQHCPLCRQSMTPMNFNDNFIGVSLPDLQGSNAQQPPPDHDPFRGHRRGSTDEAIAAVRARIEQERQQQQQQNNVQSSCSCIDSFCDRFRDCCSNMCRASSCEDCFFYVVFLIIVVGCIATPILLIYFGSVRLQIANSFEYPPTETLCNVTGRTVDNCNYQFGRRRLLSNDFQQQKGERYVLYHHICYVYNSDGTF